MVPVLALQFYFAPRPCMEGGAGRCTSPGEYDNHARESSDNNLIEENDSDENTEGKRFYLIQKSANPTSFSYFLHAIKKAVDAWRFDLADAYGVLGAILMLFPH